MLVYLASPPDLDRHHPLGRLTADLRHAFCRTGRCRAGVERRASTSRVGRDAAPTAGLDRPVHEQYIAYLGGLVRGDLGESYYFKRPVADALRERFPATAQLALTIFVLAVALGVPLGVISAVRRGGAIDRVLMISGLVAISIPSFLFGLLLCTRSRSG